MPKESSTRRPDTVEDLDRELLRLSNERDDLTARMADLTAHRDALTRPLLVDRLLDGLSDADRAALRERLAESERTE